MPGRSGSTATVSESALSSVANPHAQGGVAFLPFLAVVFKALKPKGTDVEPRTPGEHMRRRRTELGLSQRALAEHLGVNPWTILNGEKGRSAPSMRATPSILDWLGHDPLPAPGRPMPDC
ncbi:MAG: helix-turn-helix transcriptional regulator [Burkholderiales bacterium]|nr:helix-turn-helix transcriptional regulator [Burkholderiales bacterium]